MLPTHFAPFVTASGTPLSTTCNNQGTTIKHYSLLLLAALTIAIVGSMAPASAAPVQAVHADVDPAEAYAECLQDCFDQYVNNLVQCRESCRRFGFYTLFRWVGTYDRECLNDCRAAAKEVHEACKNACKKP